LCINHYKKKIEKKDEKKEYNKYIYLTQMANISYIFILTLGNIIWLISGSKLEKPLGPYESECTNIKINENLMSAECEFNGRYHKSNVQFFPHSIIENNRGILKDIGSNNKYLENYEQFYKYPEGTYVETCENLIVYQNNNLCGNCYAGTNIYKEKVITYTCIMIEPGTNQYVINVDGKLFNEYSKSAVFLFGNNITNSSSEKNFPKGDYKDTCRLNRIVGNIMYSKCKDGRGNWIDTYITIWSNSYISNSNGKLVDNPECYMEQRITKSSLNFF
jgi:hypothetical protein